MSQRVLIIKDKETEITVHKEYLHIENFEQSFIISFVHIKAIYINKSLNLDIGECYKISQIIPLFLIDHNGYILSELIKSEDA